MTDYTLVRSGRPVRLGERLGGGGEAAIFACLDRPDLAAKIYLSPPDRTKAAKLAAMADGGQPALVRVAAWPVDLLADSRKTVQGFVMPRVTARRNVHELYSPKSRAQVFPEADFRFLTHVCTNVARAFAVVHDCGHVIGDVNHGNLLVSPNGTVTLIDCDSFQYRPTGGGRPYLCEVGTDLFTPPELQGRPLRGVERTTNHDGFGLAVLLFHLLFMGRHPFAGRYGGAGEMPIERAIAEYRFAYGANRAQSLMERPPGTVPLAVMGATLADYFERAFGPAGAQGGRPDAAHPGRPDAKAWLTALASLKAGLRTCPVEGRHHYPAHLQSCPWCGVERATGVRLFGLRLTPVPATGLVDIAALWSAIVAMPPPAPDPPLPSDGASRTRKRGRVAHAPAARRLWAGRLPLAPARHFIQRHAAEQARSLRIAGSIGLGLAGVALLLALHSPLGIALMAALLGLAIAAFPRDLLHDRRLAERAQAEAEWRAALRQWREEASAARYAKQVARLEQARAELLDLPQARVRRVAELEGNRELRQKLHYLDRFRLDAAAIRGIGANRIAMLQAYGVETAADVVEEKVLGIPGFGAGLTAELLAWRRGHEANFRFNPAEPLDPQDILSVHQDFERRRAELVDLLKQGPETLKQTRTEIEAARVRLGPGVARAWAAYRDAHR